ncbi:MAG: tetratricopeptide repeat protein [Alphaproteobacteria bacterium]|nr:tetratricopeptide repeat protein [Alphaproteobacteria bacterium]
MDLAQTLQTAIVCQNAGDFAAAERLYARVLKREPTNIQALANMGSLLQAQGHLARAVDCYGSVAAQVPAAAEIRSRLGAALFTLNRPADARRHLEAAIALRPTDIDSLNNLASTLVALGDLDGALGYYRRAIALRPADPTPHLNCSRVLVALKRRREAAALLGEALPRYPADLGLRLALGEIQIEDGEFDGAIATLEDAPRIAPQASAPLLFLGIALTRAGAIDRALAAFDRALALAPNDAAIHYNRGIALRRVGPLDEAEAAAARAVALDPGSAPAFALRAALRRDRNDDAETDRCYRRSLELDPDNSEVLYDYCAFLETRTAYEEIAALGDRVLAGDPDSVVGLTIKSIGLSGLGEPDRAYDTLYRALLAAPDKPETLSAIVSMLNAQQRLEETVAVYEKLLTVRPDLKKARAGLLDALLSLCDWQRYEQVSRQVVADVAAQLESGQPLALDVFNLQALPVDYAFTAAAASHAARAIADQHHAKRFAPLVHVRPPGDRLRVGYLLGYTWIHSLPIVLKNVIERHDRDRFEIFGYSIQPQGPQEFSRAYRAAFDRFADVSVKTAAASAARIHAGGLDLLIDVTGHTATSCLPIMAFRPAPVQAHFLGYSITTGADYIDYLITDRRYIPPALAPHCSETLVYMPDTFMATVEAPSEGPLPTRTELGLPDDAVVFCNFNHPCKFEPVVFGAWMRILKAVPGSVLWVGHWFPPTQRDLREHARAHGVDPDRLVFAPIVPHGRHLARLAHADLALDCLYHGGGVTTLDTLWAGVPVLSVAGATPAARLGVSLLGAFDLPELAVASLADYETQAIALAHDRGALLALKATVARHRRTAPLFDADRYTRHLERAFAAMVEHKRAGRREPIDVPAVARR